MNKSIYYYTPVKGEDFSNEINPYRTMEKARRIGGVPAFESLGPKVTDIDWGCTRVIAKPETEPLPRMRSEYEGRTVVFSKDECNKTPGSWFYEPGGDVYCNVA